MKPSLAPSPRSEFDRLEKVSANQNIGSTGREVNLKDSFIVCLSREPLSFLPERRRFAHPRLTEEAKYWQIRKHLKSDRRRGEGRV